MSSRVVIERSDADASRFPASISFADGILVFKDRGRVRMRLRVGAGAGEVHALNGLGNLARPSAADDDLDPEPACWLVDADGRALVRLSREWDADQLRSFCTQSGIRVTTEDEEAQRFRAALDRGELHSLPGPSDGERFPDADPSSRFELAFRCVVAAALLIVAVDAGRLALGIVLAAAAIVVPFVVDAVSRQQAQRPLADDASEADVEIGLPSGGAWGCAGAIAVLAGGLVVPVALWVVGEPIAVWFYDRYATTDDFGGFLAPFLWMCGAAAAMAALGWLWYRHFGRRAWGVPLLGGVFLLMLIVGPFPGRNSTTEDARSFQDHYPRAWAALIAFGVVAMIAVVIAAVVWSTRRAHSIASDGEEARG